MSLQQLRIVLCSFCGPLVLLCIPDKTWWHPMDLIMMTQRCSIGCRLVEVGRVCIYPGLHNWVCDTYMSYRDLQVLILFNYQFTVAQPDIHAHPSLGSLLLWSVLHTAVTQANWTIHFFNYVLYVDEEPELKSCLHSSYFTIEHTRENTASGVGEALWGVGSLSQPTVPTLSEQSRYLCGHMFGQ